VVGLSDVKLNEEYDFYVENHAALTREYAGKFVVIKNQKVLGAHDSREEALIATLETEDAGAFLVQFCAEDGQVPTQRFHSRA
jgi:hypothetical protein